MAVSLQKRMPLDAGSSPPLISTKYAFDLSPVA